MTADELDDRPDWERNLSTRDLAILRTERWLVEADFPEGAVCSNCRLPKTLRSSGRCYACEKYHQRRGVERPQRLVDKEILRGWA